MIIKRVTIEFVDGRTVTTANAGLRECEVTEIDERTIGQDFSPDARRGDYAYYQRLTGNYEISLKGYFKSDVEDE